jgi:hypothetical protein
VHYMRMLFDFLPVLLVEFGQVLGPGDPAASLSLAGGQP